MVGSADDHQPLLPPRLGLDEPRAPRVADDPEVGIAVFDRFEHPLGMEVFQADVGLGMLPAKLLHVAAHVVEPHGVDRRHADSSRHLLVERADLVLQGLVLGDQLAAAVEKDLALAGGHERPLRSLDQLHPEMALELADDLAGPRLGNAVGLGRPGETPAGDDVAEDLEGLEVHGIPPTQDGPRNGVSASSLMKNPNTPKFEYSEIKYNLAWFQPASTVRL
jgi:hypothetical protein